MTLPIKLAETFAEELVGSIAADFGQTCAFADAAQHLGAVAAGGLMKLTFGKHEINVGKTEEGIVGGVEDCVAVRRILSLVLVVGFGGVDIFDAHVSLSLIAAGAIGNMIDRIRFDYVVDFIYFVLINFPIFNVADIYVSVSTVVLVILLLFVYQENDLSFIGFKQKRYRELK